VTTIDYLKNIRQETITDGTAVFSTFCWPTNRETTSKFEDV